MSNIRFFKRPVVTEEVGVSPPENSELRKIAEDVLQAAQYTFAAVAANPNARLPPNSLGAAFRDVLQGMSLERRTNIEAHAQQLVKMDKVARQAVFGRYGIMDAESMLAKGFENAAVGLPALALDAKLLGMAVPTLTIPDIGILKVTDEGLLIPRSVLLADFEEFAKDWKETKAKSAQSALLSERLTEIWGQTYHSDPFASSMESFEEFEEQAITDKLAFYITKVKCIDETNPEWWGSDEIAIGAITVDEDGDTDEIAETYVGGGFDDGDCKVYDPPWRYTYFNLREGNLWPKRYTVSLLLAEKDCGGFSTALNKLWTLIRDEVKKRIAEAVGAGLTPYLGAAIASAIGKAVAWVIDRFIRWFINAFKDDIFPPMVLTCTVPSFYARWYYPNGTWGSTQSQRMYAHCYGHGGHYSVQYFWRLFS